MSKMAGRPDAPSALGEQQMRSNVIASVLLAALLPPFVGGTLMGLVGFYPMPEFYLIFFSYTGAYVLSVVLASLWLAFRAVERIVALTRTGPAQAALDAQKLFAKLPWILLASVSIYSIFGALSADFSLESMGLHHYTASDHWLNQFGLIPVVLITSFPIFFHLIDSLGRYLGPRGITVTAVPLWVKITTLGVVTPMLIDSLLIGYYYNRTGYFEFETLVAWLSLLGLALGGTWIAWRSLRLGIAPLQAFIGSQAGVLDERVLENLTPLSLDELGPLTANIAALLNSQKVLTDDLRRSESLASAVIDHAGVLVLVLDSEGCILRFNHACEALSGLSSDEVKGRHPWETFIPPEEADAVRQHVFEAFLNNPAAMQGQFTNYWQHKNGQRRLTEWFNTVQLDAEGRLEFLISVGADITERSATEHAKERQREELERLVSERTNALADALTMNQQVLATSAAGILVYRESGQCVFANEAAAKMVGGTTEQMLRQNFREAPTWKPAGIYDVALATLNDGEPRVREYHMVTSFGKEAWFESSFSRFTRAGENHLMLMASDITQRKQTETELIRARDEAQHASKAKSAFLARMSHELRTPMNAILGFAQVLEMEPALDPDLRGFVAEIHRAGDHLLEMINDLLDLSRIESGKLAFAVEATRLRPLIQQALQIIKPMQSTQQIVIHEHDIPSLHVLADAARLRQVLLNLLSNAIKYNRPGGQVDIECRQLGGKRLQLRITDTGPGLTEEQIKLLFRPFERLGAEFSAVDGAGIGLALSKQLTELMGGELGVESTPGQGSTFWIELPLALSASKGTAAPAPAADQGKKLCVLYVEDNAANLRVVEAMLRRQPSLQLLTATNGEDGLELARRVKPALILLDIHLPGMSGYQVLAALQDDPGTRDIPVIALSADAMPLDIETGLKAGFRRYLTKPIKTNELLEAIAAVLVRPLPG